MTPTDELIPVLKKLCLGGLLHTLELRKKQAIEENLDLNEFLHRLLGDELERRETKKLQDRLERANFEHGKTLEAFDFLFNIKVPRSKVIELATCGFVDRHEALLLVGPAGVGKSHLAQAIGHRAVRRGMNVLFLGANQLFAQLRAGRGDGTYDKRLARLAKVDLLVLDDLGLRPLRGDEPEDLHELIRQRYERGAWIVTSNRALTEWPAMFNDALLASAALDRLLHNAHVLEIDGESYRGRKKT